MSTWIVYREGQEKPVGQLDSPTMDADRAVYLASVVYGIPVDQVSVRLKPKRKRKGT